MAGATGGGARGEGARGGRSAARAVTDVAVLVGAAVLCLASVVLAGALGPVPLSGDGLLDRLAAESAQALDDAPAGDQEVLPGTEEAPAAPERTGIPPEVVLSLAAAVVAGALLARSLLRARRDPAATPEDEPEDLVVPGTDDDLVEAVAGAARAGLDRLDDGTTSAGDAVLACWVALEAAGARAGRGRAAPDTPTGFAARLRAAVPALDPAVLDELRTTYSRVRFGPAGADETDVARSRGALQALLAVLEPAGRAGPVAPVRGGTR